MFLLATLKYAKKILLDNIFPNSFFLTLEPEVHKTFLTLCKVKRKKEKK